MSKGTQNSTSGKVQGYDRIMSLFNGGFDTVIATQGDGIGEYVSYVKTFTGNILFVQDHYGFEYIRMISDERLAAIIEEYELLEEESDYE